MSEDPRCCGTGTCIINDEGLCWCGQQWDGEKMCFPNKKSNQELGSSDLVRSTALDEASSSK
jgi:hypothetical protein